MNELAVSSDVAIVKPRNVPTITQADARPLLRVRSAGLTDPGKVREGNEDQFLIAQLLKALEVKATSLPLPKLQKSEDQSYLFVVADGMGGHAGGQHASALAVSSVESFMLKTFKWFFACRGKEADELLAEFQSALGQANARVLSKAAEHPELRGMGTTLTLAYSLNDILFVAHVGDSRAYLHRGGALHRLTSDHTLVEDMVRIGTLRAEEAAQHRWRHVITNAVGGDSPDIKVEVHKLHLEAGDGLLLCSDGLTEMVSDAEIGRILVDLNEPEEACKCLVDRANQAGGKDNITVILARYESAA
jgi:serine/threonine protein phosphatase PrpC